MNLNDYTTTQCTSFGQISYYIDLINLIHNHKDEIWSEAKILTHLHAQHDNYPANSGCLKLATAIGLVIDTGDAFEVNNKEKFVGLSDEHEFTRLFLKRLLDIFFRPFSSKQQRIP